MGGDVSGVVVGVLPHQYNWGLMQLPQDYNWGVGVLMRHPQLLDYNDDNIDNDLHFD